jgi:hypothetical protein
MYSGGLKQISFLVFTILASSSSQKIYSQNNLTKNHLLNNCYILKPVYDDSEQNEPSEFEFAHDSINNCLKMVFSSPKSLRFDSSMAFVTGYQHQKGISINTNCFSKIINPDSSYLTEIFYNSSIATGQIISSVEFLQSYKKNILNFGSAVVYEFRFNDVVEASSHFMYIIIKIRAEKTEWEDFKGIVICSDGMDWKDYKDKGLSIPLFIQMVRRSKEFYIPLYFDGKRFIPIDHFKSSNWQE